MEVADMREEANKKLIKIYNQWIKELYEKAPNLLGNDYSNPYYTSIPENWFESSGPRIMIVGEEGFGEWANGKGEIVPVRPDEIEKIQSFNYSYLREQLRIDDGEINSSAFWRRFRKVAEKCLPKCLPCPFSVHLILTGVLDGSGRCSWESGSSPAQ